MSPFFLPQATTGPQRNPQAQVEFGKHAVVFVTKNKVHIKATYRNREYKCNDPFTKAARHMFGCFTLVCILVSLRC